MSPGWQLRRLHERCGLEGAVVGVFTQHAGVTRPIELYAQLDADEREIDLAVEALVQTDVLLRGSDGALCASPALLRLRDLDLIAP